MGSRETADAIVQRCRALDTCALSDALDRLGLSGVADGLLPLSNSVLIAGRAQTVSLGLVDPDAALPTRHLCTAAVEASGPDSILVVGHPGTVVAAGWGGLLSRAARRRGIQGTIVDGPARDIAEAQEMGYPLYARSATPVTARGRIVEQAWGVPVQLGTVTVKPGDLVVADASGVVIIEHEVAEQVVELAESIASREAAMAAAIDEGHPITDVMGRTYEQMNRET